jgi:hypothetical protein
MSWRGLDRCEAAVLPILALPKQDAFLVEAGYHVWNHRLTPFVQFQARDFAGTGLPGRDSL